MVALLAPSVSGDVGKAAVGSLLAGRACVTLSTAVTRTSALCRQLHTQHRSRQL